MFFELFKWEVLNDNFQYMTISLVNCIIACTYWMKKYHPVCFSPLTYAVCA